MIAALVAPLVLTVVVNPSVGLLTVLHVTLGVAPLESLRLMSENLVDPAGKSLLSVTPYTEPLAVSNFSKFEGAIFTFEGLRRPGELGGASDGQRRAGDVGELRVVVKRRAARGCERNEAVEGRASGRAHGSGEEGVLFWRAEESAEG